MTQVFTEEGAVVPVTVVEAGPVVVTQLRSQGKEGYNAVQVGFEAASPKRVNMPLAGHFAKAGVSPTRYLREFRVDDSSDMQIGQEIKVDIFKPGDKISVTGVSKGKGFAGVVKRHHFRGGDASHGSMFHRAPGSIGGSSYPSRVFPGMKAAGHMGTQRVTVRNLEVVEVDSDDNVLMVKGAIPGPNGGYVIVRRAKR
jgi:large subunit ribosomal protein L3